jgi:Phosphotransferase enzyme family
MPVATPWWQDIAPVVGAARMHRGIEVTILRLLAADRDRPPGGEVTYLAQVEVPVPASPWDGALDDQPLRLPYARPSGPDADLVWARDVLARRGRALLGRPVQVRTWNLSSVWRLPVDGGAAWLKAVPPFFAHEGELLARLAGMRVPTLLAHDGGRMLMNEIAGEDLYDAPTNQLLAMVDLLVDLQSRWMDNAAGLLSLGLPDRRTAVLNDAIGALLGRIGDCLDADERRRLDRFVAGLPARWAGVAACGLADTLVHGDFHPGNFRGEALDLTLLDWGDSCVGHPLLDQSAFLDRISAGAVPAVRAHWTKAWQDMIAGCDPDRAAILLAPVATARQAVIYQGFLDNIEPAEHPYHRVDPADWLRRTARLLG